MKLPLLQITLGGFITVVLLGLVVWLIKSWLVSVKEALTETASRIYQEISALRKDIKELFDRQDEEVKSRYECRLQAAQQFASKKDVEKLTERVSRLEKHK